MCLLAPFLIIPRVHIITGSAVVLRCYIFSIYIPRALYLFVLSYALTDMLFCVVTAILFRRHFFKYFIPNDYSIALYFAISFNIKNPENCSFFFFSNWFCLAFILFFPIQYSIVFTYFTLNAMFYFIMHCFIFY